MRVFLTHNPEDLEVYFARALVDLQAVVEVILNPTPHDLDTSELLQAAAGCELMIAHRSMPADAALFAGLPDLLAFLRCGTDAATIDVEAASANGVLVTVAEATDVASIAELALGLYLDTARHITPSTRDYHAGRMPPQRPGSQLRGRVAGVIGLDPVGSYLADILSALGMQVLVHDASESAQAASFEAVDLGELLARSDVVFPMGAATSGHDRVIGSSELAAMNPGATLVSVSRGDLVDDVAVAESLDRGHLGALALDVGPEFDERPSPDLASRMGVVATPHLGGLTPESADAQATGCVEQVKTIVGGAMPPRTLNAPHASRLQARSLKG